MTIRKFISAMVMFTLLFQSTGVYAQETTLPTHSAPAAYTELYEQLYSGIAEFRTRLPQPASLPSKAGTLLTANAHTADAMLDPKWAKGQLIYIQRLHEMGNSYLVLETAYPLFTPEFTNEKTWQYLEAYKTVVDYARSLGMKIVVKHNVMIPGYTKLPIEAYYKTLTPKRFGAERYREVATLIKALRPDFVTLVGETSTHNASLGLKLREKDWVYYVQAVLQRLPKDVPESRSVRFGATVGNWESPSLAARYASVPGLSYIDLHIYPVSSRKQNFLDHVMAIAQSARKASPEIRFVVGETWLYKAAPGETQGIAATKAIFARDVWDFWSPLDAIYIDTVMRIGGNLDAIYVAPFWSKYFFAYLDYRAGKALFMSDDAQLQASSKAAFSAMQKGLLSPTGVAWKAYSR